MVQTRFLPRPCRATRFLNRNLLVEACGAFCKPKYKYEVTDVKELKAGDVTWTESQDHAKWAVALDSSNVACIGDINRMTSQEKRGGGTVCFSSSALSNALYNSITTSDTCSRR